jgi:transposase
MLCLIPIVGGLLIMMGQHDRSEALFYYFRLEDQVPETHLLRLIEKHISFAFVREQLKDRYSETGRPSIDPELLLRILLIGYLYGISSERKLVEELRMHLAWRWFTGLGFDQGIPHHSTFSKNRHGRFHESRVFEQLFEQIVARCLEVGLVRGDNLSVDGSFVEANANKESRIPREQLAEAAQVKLTVRQYLVELEQRNPTEEPVQYRCGVIQLRRCFCLALETGQSLALQGQPGHCWRVTDTTLRPLCRKFRSTLPSLPRTAWVGCTFGSPRSTSSQCRSCRPVW